MASLGCKHDDIATMLGISVKTLRKYSRGDLDCGSIEPNAKVLQTLMMASWGKNTAAPIFWAKTRCGLREKQQQEQPMGDGTHWVLRVE